MSQKNIVFLIGNYKNGGVARHSTTLANEMARKGHVVTILVTGECGEELPSLQAGVRLVNMNEFSQDKNKDQRVVKDSISRKRHLAWLKRFRNLFQWIPLVRHRLSAKIDFVKRGERLRSFFLLQPHSIIIAFSMPFVNEAYSSTYDLNCPIIFAEKNASQLENADLLSQRDNASCSLQHADACVFQTYDEKAQYDGIPLKHPVVIRNPIRPDLPEPYYGKRKNVIVNFCRLSRQKNLHLLIGAFEMLHREFPRYELEIYGNIVSNEEEELKIELISLVKKKKLESSIRILPPCLDVHDKIVDYAMFVSSSDYEGLSNSMLEAMAIGLPCVCTDCLGGGAREIIQHGVNGLLTPVKDANALCEAMKAFVVSPELAEKCGRNASRVRTELAAESIAEEWLQVIKDVSEK